MTGGCRRERFAGGVPPTYLLPHTYKLHFLYSLLHKHKPIFLFYIYTFYTLSYKSHYYTSLSSHLYFLYYYLYDFLLLYNYYFTLLHLTHYKQKLLAENCFYYEEEIIYVVQEESIKCYYFHKQ